MGYQLWTSPITGYRRQGTRLSELRSLIDSALTIRAILEPLQSCPANAPATHMARAMSERDFDVAGVQINKDGPVVGFVERQDLVEGLVSNYQQPLSPENLISADTTLPTALSVLSSKPRVFVLLGTSVKGIATRADLNKPAARIYLFSLVSLLEMHLAFWIRVEYPNDTWCEKISDGRLANAKKVHGERHAAGQDSELIDCLQMADKRDLLLKCKDLCGQLGFKSKRAAKKRFDDAEALRNLLAHGQQDLVQGTSWEQLFNLVGWLESVIGRSDDLVEQRAAAARKDNVSTLWSSA